MKNHKHFITLGVALLLGFICLLASQMYYSYEHDPIYSPDEVRKMQEENIVLGNQLVGAIERYKLQEGIYPETLQDLVPNILIEPILTTYGEVFEYKQGTFHDRGFDLLFRFTLTRRGALVTCNYSELHEWNCINEYPYLGLGG